MIQFCQERMGMSERVGYIRISSYSQNHARQLQSIELTKSFKEIASGKGTGVKVAALRAHFSIFA